MTGGGAGGTLFKLTCEHFSIYLKCCLIFTIYNLGTVLSEQIEQVTSKYQDVIILGDANIDTNKWNDEKFTHKKVAMALKDSLNANNLNILNIGNTYLANHAQKNGVIASSAIDHVYCSNNLKSKIST